MGVLEIIAALLGVINVLLVVRRSTWNYPFGIAMVALYFFVFAHAKLYSDALLQVFFFVIQIYGWWDWYHAAHVDQGVAVRWMSWRERLPWIVGTVLAIILWATGMARLTDAAAPYVDATNAGLSVAAQCLQSLRRIESWVLWICADFIALGLYPWRALYWTTGLYVLLLILSVIGLIEWRRRVRA